MLFSILGDSLSTYGGCNPAGYAVYYTEEKARMAHLSSPDETWWGRVLKAFDGTLCVNGSYSGSYVAGCTDVSARSERRAEDLGDGDRKPDIILVCMGANDCGEKVPLHGSVEDDPFAFDTSYARMLKNLRTLYPRASVFCMTLMLTAREAEGKSPGGKSLVCAYNDVIRTVCRAEGCTLLDVYADDAGFTTVDGLHPDADGHALIASRVIDAMKKSS